MATHTFVLLLRITAKQYADAARQLRAGNVSASPLAVALTEQGGYVLSGYASKRIRLMDIQTGQRYTGTVPTALAEYLAGFRRDRRVPEDHEFELVLVSQDA
jgi:hypothetical protein